MSDNVTAEKLTPGELQQIEAELIERRRVLMNDFRAMEEAEAGDASDLSRVSTHLADLGSDRASSDVSLASRASASVEIQDIDGALERLRDGTFGQCEECDKAISKGRLEAIPYARLCLPCKQQEEV